MKAHKGEDEMKYCVVVNVGACTARPLTVGDERGFHESLLVGSEDLSLEEAQEVAAEWRLWCERIAES